MSFTCGMFVRLQTFLYSSCSLSLFHSFNPFANVTANSQRRRSKIEEKKPKRTHTFSIFDPSLDALKRMIKNATMITPLKFHDDPAASRVLALTREHSMTRPMLDIMEAVFNNLRGNNPELSKEAFLQFLKEIQGEINIQLEKDNYSEGEFLYILADSWDATRRPSEKDHSKPITNYFINSSHNTYISGNQLASKTSPEAYTSVRTINLTGLNKFDILMLTGFFV
jgi:phosphatidylinositol phospholipase C delta